MDTAYLFNWLPGSAGSFEYGSDIFFASNGEVRYRNPLTPPGTAIHQWNTGSVPDELGAVPLPTLIAGTKWRVSADIIARPTGTVGVEITFLDGAGQVLTSNLYDDVEVEFEVPAGTVNYYVALVNFNSHEVIFRSLLLIPLLPTISVEDDFNDAEGLLALKMGSGERGVKVFLLAGSNTVMTLPVIRDMTSVFVLRGIGKRNVQSIDTIMDGIAQQYGKEHNEISVQLLPDNARSRHQYRGYRENGSRIFKY